MGKEDKLRKQQTTLPPEVEFAEIEAQERPHVQPKPLPHGTGAMPLPGRDEPEERGE